MSTFNRIVEIFQFVMEDPELSLNLSSSPIDINGWDSFKHVQIVMRCEEIFDVKFKISEIEKIKNISDLVFLVDNKLLT